MDYSPLLTPKDLVTYMSQGLSNIECAAKFEIAEKTFYRWRQEYPEFEEAYQKGDPQRFAYLMSKADQYFLEDKNDKGYKHWLKKVAYMYKDYAPESSSTNIQIGNISNVTNIEYQGKSPDQLYQILQTKLSHLKPIDVIDTDYKVLDDRQDEQKDSE